MTRTWLILLLTVFVLPIGAQQISVQDYKRHHRNWWTRIFGPHWPVDKQQATLDLATSEKGFTFKADGKTDIQAKEQDGKLTLLLPDQTQFIVIEHPDFGQKTWRVPEKKGVRKKHYYEATLQGGDPKKTYKMKWQWVVFNVSPRNAIIHVDSTIFRTRDGQVALRMDVGKHGYLVEAPFYEEQKDSFEVSDSMKVNMQIALQPAYSYLTVQTPWKRGEIYIDGQAVAMQEGTSFRLAPGDHRLSVFLGEACCYDEPFTIGRAEKKTITLAQHDFNIQPVGRPTPNPSRGEGGKNVTSFTSTPLPSGAAGVGSFPSGGAGGRSAGGMLLADNPVTLQAADDSTEIWVDCEQVGIGKWQGTLSLGFHIVATKKDGMESVPAELWVAKDTPKLIDLSVPQTSSALVNIFSNVVGADIYINNVRVGKTPYVIQGLSATRSYDICLRKDSWPEAHATVRPRGNGLTDVNIPVGETINNRK